MKYWLGITYLKPFKNIINIVSEDGFNIVINLQNDEKFLYNKIDNGLVLKADSIIINKSENLKSSKNRILGFTKFITNLVIILRRYIKHKKLKNEDLNIFYKNFYKLVHDLLNDS